jgi:hypothetical protein
MFFCIYSDLTSARLVLHAPSLKNPDLRSSKRQLYSTRQAMHMNKKLITYTVSFAAFFGLFTQSIYTPMLPQVQQLFHTSEYMVNLTISIFTVVMAFMQMVYGPSPTGWAEKRS